MSSRATRTAPTIKLCWMPAGIQQALIALAQHWDPLEVGGVLAGYWDGAEAVITDWVGPGENANHQRFNYTPDYDFHTKEIERLYAASEGTTIYLGDWHTHPSGASRLSPVDKRTLQMIADAPDAQCPRPLMLLLAGRSEDWSIQVFTLGPERRFFSRKIVQVELRTF